VLVCSIGNLVKDISKAHLPQDRHKAGPEPLGAVAADAAAPLEGEGGEGLRQDRLGPVAVRIAQHGHQWFRIEDPSEDLALFCTVAARLQRLERVVEDCLVELLHGVVRPALGLGASVRHLPRTSRLLTGRVGVAVRLASVLQPAAATIQDWGAEAVEQEERGALFLGAAAPRRSPGSPAPAQRQSELLFLPHADLVRGEKRKVQLVGVRRPRRPGLHGMAPGGRCRWL
jgi:hypothetical protein